MGPTRRQPIGTPGWNEQAATEPLERTWRMPTSYGTPQPGDDAQLRAWLSLITKTF